MNRHSVLIASAIIAFGLATLSDGAVAQEKSLKEQIVGAWILVSFEATAPDGKKTFVMGPNRMESPSTMQVVNSLSFSLIRIVPNGNQPIEMKLLSKMLNPLFLARRLRQVRGRLMLMERLS